MQVIESRLAMAGAKLKGYFAEKAKARMSAGGGDQKSGVENLPPPISDQGKARDQAASKVGVSGKSVDMAEVIIKKGVPALVKMVEAGEISLHSGEGEGAYGSRTAKRRCGKFSTGYR